MIRVCYRCKKVYGEKPPLGDKRVTHGLCDVCFPLEEARLYEEMRVEEEKRRLEVGGLRLEARAKRSASVV